MAYSTGCFVFSYLVRKCVTDNESKPSKMKFTFYILIFCLLNLWSCSGNKNDDVSGGKKIAVILDTDANNELDDQHAIAYLLNSQDVFDIEGITVNTTRNGGMIQQQYDEAMRIVTLFNEQDRIPVKKGADGSFDDIRNHIDEPDFDGAEAVDFIISAARKHKDNGLVLIPVGKLTNLALALEKAPDISSIVRIVWLGSNYPEPGEYNLENDTSALNYILDTDVIFEMVTVRYGKPDGTWAILVTLPEIDSVMPGKGPEIASPIIGRHGGSFTHFGDYSVDLFHHIEVYGNPPARSLYDVGAVAVVKNPGWAENRELPAPRYTDSGWEEKVNNDRKIRIWENFKRDSIVSDLFKVLE